MTNQLGGFMFSALFSFLGGSAFRMIWGEISSFVEKRQEHAQEIERMKLQGELDNYEHARNMEALRVQSELGIKEVQIKSVADLANIDAEGFYRAFEAAEKPSGIAWVDAWAKVIRPLTATLCIAMLGLAFYQGGFVVTAFFMDLISSVLGFFFADRSLAKRGK